MSCNFWVVRSAKGSKRCHSVLLTNLKSNHRATREVLDKGQVLGKYILVNTVEFFNNRLAEVEKLHGRDLKACLKNGFNNLTSFSFTLDVRFNEAESAIVEDTSSLHGSFRGLFSSKPVLILALHRS